MNRLIIDKDKALNCTVPFNADIDISKTIAPISLVAKLDLFIIVDKDQSEFIVLKDRHTGANGLFALKDLDEYIRIINTWENLLSAVGDLHD